MTLVLFRPYENTFSWSSGFFSQEYLMHFSLFLVCAHIWMGIFIKQLKYNFLRQNAVFLVFLSGALLALILEIFRFSFNFAESFSLMSFFIDMTGVLAGIGIFRLVYRSCY